MTTQTGGHWENKNSVNNESEENAAQTFQCLCYIVGLKLCVQRLHSVFDVFCLLAPQLSVVNKDSPEINLVPSIGRTLEKTESIIYSKKILELIFKNRHHNMSRMKRQSN